MERDFELFNSARLISHFNSHAHVERDAIREELEQAIKDFNSHAHVERDLRAVMSFLTLPKFQLTRSRGA